MEVFDNGFEAMLARIHEATGTHTQLELAILLGVRQSAISDARRGARIPEEWLLSLLRTHRINPDWILGGILPVYLRGGAALEEATCAECPGLQLLEQALEHMRLCARTSSRRQPGSARPRHLWSRAARRRHPA